MQQFDAVVVGAGAAGLALRRHRRPARAARAADRPCSQGGGEDPHLGRRALQLHQSRHLVGELPVGQPGLLPLGAGTLHAGATSSRCCSATTSAGTRSTTGSCSATTAAEDIIDMLLRECAAGGSHALAALRSARGAPVRRRLRDRHRSRKRRFGQRRRRHRRPVDPEDRRQRLRLSPGTPVRDRARRDAPGAGAADLRRGAVGAVRGTGRPVAGGPGRHRRGPRTRAVRRGSAVHPPRTERPGDPADLELLASRRAARHRPGAWASTSPARCCAAKASSRRKLANELATLLPHRLADTWLAPHPGWADKPMAEMRDRDLLQACRVAAGAGS